VKLTVAFNDSTFVTDTCIISVYDKSQFYGLWHYTQGKGDYESIIFYPNKIINITIQETGLTYAGNYEIFNETLQINIDQIHQYGRYFYKINDSNKLTLINKKNRDNAVYIKQRKDPHTLYVGGTGKDNYSTIQEGIENAWYGDNIYVYEGIYHENIMITKSINLMGATGKKTFIDGRGNGHVIEIHANMVNISNFTIMNSSSSSSFSGIKITSSSHITIDTCNITDNFYGLWIYESTRNTIKNSTIAHNKFDGIMMNEIASENEITQCVITHNDRNGITLCCGSNYNSITHCTISENNDTGVSIQALGNVIVLNNFIKNHLNAYGYGTNFWDNGNQGNYWSDFDEPSEGAYDHNKDYVIDTPYTKIGVNNKDRYPLSHLQT
jgi:parallel beta-helix repeat protein